MKRSRKSFPSRVAVAAVVAAGCAVLALAAERAQAGIINPSFETGDLTGWTALASWTILADGGSDGQHYATVRSPDTDYPQSDDYMWLQPQGWVTIISQVFCMPAWAEKLSLDVRNQGLRLNAYLYPYESDELPTQRIDIIDGAMSPASNGFTRYVADVSDYVELRVRLEVNVGQDYVPAEHLSVALDNIRILPEPGTFALLSAWGLASVIRRFKRC